ncbi:MULTISPECIES: hypothetical protein [unclassified Christiangramia]|jgi:hypothetical protein|uniref:hypothetical protein n=1 Tax=unclassified Christiangramia TaxID=2615027 RepID=UPI0011510311|nr:MULTISPECIES: hypothetical protein [unclassified Christiangramia]TQI69149.1 hypothetical protein JM79_0017 [Gramella sp. Hel_I_59]WPY98545.1 hypothetical protein T8I65_15380 [Christiangramia sp. OXR-203]
MKYFIYFIIFLAVVFIGVSVSSLDLNALLEGDSANALIVILASLCVIILMSILLVSRTISRKHG